MKKIIPTIAVVALFTIIFLLCFRSCVGASDIVSEEINAQEESLAIEKEAEEKQDLKEYIKDRIVPIVVGVLTSIAGIISTIHSVKKSLRALGNLKNAFSEEKKQREESLADNKKMLQEEISRVKEQTRDLPQINDTVNQLKKEMAVIGKMFQLMCSANPDLVKTGKARKMELLSNKLSLVDVSDSSEETSNDEDKI